MSWYESRNTCQTRSDVDLLKDLLTCDNGTTVGDNNENKNQPSDTSKGEKPSVPQKRKRVEKKNKSSTPKKKRVKVNQNNFI